ncbi:MAG: phosphoenolpyruvate carboxykinase (ATP) [Negativicutes bacterium]|nr:phosphoenolpyruvate carboxykinase (ATP) [Negativicutes bacterium]
MPYDVLSDLRAAGHCRQIYRNLPVARLVEMSLARGENSQLTDSGALRVSTGRYTGRSPNDKFVVDHSQYHDEIWWSNNQSVAPAVFDGLYNKVLAYLAGRDLFVFDGFAGADRRYSLPVRIINEFAWQNIFVHQLFIRPEDTGWQPPEQPQFTVLCAPGFQADPAVDGTKSEAFIILDFLRRLVLIGGSHYAGEMKKSIFTVCNYLLPRQGVLPMHCSANKNARNETSLFFGLSGTGKTTLSADPNLFLIGDDEHGWTDRGIFNIEGGCYAKCIRLSRENEPQIWNALRFGAILENVVIDPHSRSLNFDSEEIPENTRAGYPVTYIDNCVYPGTGGQPRTIIFLTADAFGVLPPIARLTPEQAMYYFMSGYTSKLAGTERGVTEPQATFSACFGQPFLPLPPVVYAKMLEDRIRQHNVRVFLLNTGWQGGAYGAGRRISIKYSRAMVNAAVNGWLDTVAYRTHSVFNLEIPLTCPGIPDDVLYPSRSWPNRDEYYQTAKKLAVMFTDNFRKRFADSAGHLFAAGPQP